ncbi:SusE domain-containing protein [Hymenobacter sp. NST-14]|uniref:SusE domain-containing protein n=1 Tax=Hymenobacter piscis TaxID=2839984 RepID=UPI001C014F5C|nr:SusE domain-containing protein [Hymenobacter piscis]MBT9392811.1 SusE domain-containing protein [Hymenobacter piscis]
MKNWLSTLAGFCSLLFVFSACEKDETRATLTPSNAPTLSLSNSSVTLVQANESQTALTYTWTPISSFAWSNVEHPYDPAVTYDLQIDLQGNDFASAVAVPAGSGPTTRLRVDSLNAALNSLGLSEGVATPLEVRLRASYAANAPIYSGALPLTASAYKVCLPPNTDRWSIIGPAGVDWNTDVPLVYDCATETYKLTRALNAGEFKFRKNSDWGVNFGSDSPRNGDGTGPLNANGANISVATSGTYTITFDLNTNTYTLSN